MSIIAGIVKFDGSEVPDSKIFEMTDALKEFPVNAVGQWGKRSVFLGCHQQWITPESIHESNPLYDETRQAVIASDSILDNRVELFERLQVDHAVRKIITDTELILLAYRKWGEECPKYLIGDFAFMIWDVKNNVLFGARDLLGGRNLYYRRDSQYLLFCSLITPILNASEAERSINERWLAQFLAIPSTVDSTDALETAYKDIYQLPPGHLISVHQDQVSIRSYGSLIPNELIRYKSDDEYLEAFRDLFDTAVHARLRTYRQAGATLSGGLDSSAVVSFAASKVSEEGKVLHTYSMVPARNFVDWTPKDEMADESPFIQRTIDYVGNIAGSYLDSTGISPYSEIDDLLDIMELPFKNFESAYRIREIYRHAAKDDVGVLLTGARGNYTISWGSAIDYYVLLLKRMRLIEFYRQVNQFSRQTRVGRSRILSVIRNQAFPFMHPSESEPEIPSLIHPDLARRTDVFRTLQGHDVGLTASKNNVLTERQDYFNNLAVLNLQSKSASKFSARYKVWERDATSDVRLVRFCLALPFEQYVHGGIGRAMVRRATQGRLPDEVRLNQRIRGAQGVDWLHRIIPQWRQFAGEVSHIINDKSVDGLLNVAQLRDSLGKFGSAPQPEQAGDPDLKLLVRSVIIYRFLKKFL